VLALKGNQGKLYHQVETWFEQVVANDWAGLSTAIENVEAGHHRLEIRQVFAVPVQITTVASPKSVGGINHRGHGQAAATVME